MDFVGRGSKVFVVQSDRKHNRNRLTIDESPPDRYGYGVVAGACFGWRAFPSWHSTTAFVAAFVVHRVDVGDTTRWLLVHRLVRRHVGGFDDRAERFLHGGLVIACG